MLKSPGFGVRAAIASVMLLGGVSTTALAADRGHGSHNHYGNGYGHGSHRSCDWNGHINAGAISIDGCRTTIRSDHDVRSQVARAFRRAGYRAYSRHGQIVVDFGHRRPNVRWFSEGYRTNIRWQQGCLSISLFSSPCGSCQPNYGHQGKRERSTFNRRSWSHREYVGPRYRNRCR